MAGLELPFVTGNSFTATRAFTEMRSMQCDMQKMVYCFRWTWTLQCNAMQRSFMMDATLDCLKKAMHLWLKCWQLSLRCARAKDVYVRFKWLLLVLRGNAFWSMARKYISSLLATDSSKSWQRSLITTLHTWTGEKWCLVSIEIIANSNRNAYVRLYSCREIFEKVRN